MIIQHNMMAMMMGRQLNINSKGSAKRTERLSSGYRINRAADDAASLAISEKMRSQIRGLQKGSKNVQEGIGFCNVADGALNEVNDILVRIKELAVQAASDTYVEEDRKAIEEEFEHLKEEINRISRTTEYNTKRIFDDGSFKIEWSDEVCPIKIFNASHGNPDDPDTYGGIIIGDDVRVEWTAIDPDMVYTDPNTQETCFRAGEYRYEYNNYSFLITCEEGSKPPEITVEFEVKASGGGISFAGSTVQWEDVVNEKGESILDHIGEEGYYHFKNHDGEAGFYVEAGATLGDIIQGLNDSNGKTQKTFINVYSGYYVSQAVDVVDAGTKLQVSQDMYDNYISQNIAVGVGVELRADDDAIWAVDENGTELTGSRKTWTSLGLEHWSSTNDVSDQKTYTYAFSSSDGKVKIDFDFFLLDETSKQSVIEGINGMKLQEGDAVTSNKTECDIETTGNNISSGKMTAVKNPLTLEEEGELGRNFDTRYDADFAEGDLTYDVDSDTFTATFTSATGTTQLTYDTTSLTTLNELKQSAQISMQYLRAKAVQSAMSNLGPFNTIEDVVGVGNITNTGYFSETYTTNADTIKTSGLGNGTFAASSIDFSGLGTNYQLYDLLGTGFDSTCMTCNNHYSVLFVYGGTSNTTASGYGYDLTSMGSDYCLQIDLKTMMEKGITTGEDFTKALVEVLDKTFDFHYTQYATDTSGKLYICDNRSSYVGTSSVKNADFYMQPYNVNDVTINLKLENTTDSRYMNMSYTYDIFSELKANITAQMQQEDANGLYVQDASGKWKLYDPADYYDGSGNLLPGVSAPSRFNIRIVENVDWDDTYDKIMQTIADNTKWTISATDYAYLSCETNENPNEAYVSVFRSELKEEEEDGMWIQAGPNRYQGLFLKWDGFSSHYLGLSFLSMTDREEAGTLMERADKAIEKISGIRSAFGAYTNRLEKIYDMNQNYEENIQAAESKIRDADMAKELMAKIKSDLLQQATQMLFSQTTQQAEQVLKLLE